MDLDLKISLIDKIRDFIRKGKISEALDSLDILEKHVNNRSTKDQIIMVCSSLNRATKDRDMNISNDNTNVDKSIYASLKILSDIEESVSKERQDVLINDKNVDLYKAHRKLKSKVENFKDISDEEKEEVYFQSLILKKAMYEGIDEKFKDHPHILFNRIFFAQELDYLEIKDIASVPTDNRFMWYEKSIIVSALSLSIIRQFNPQKVDLLINFISPFEDKVWQRALAGILLGLYDKEHLLKLYPELVNRLRKFREIDEIERGIYTVSHELSTESYNGCFKSWYEFMGQDSFKVLRNVDNWFLPYYENNPIVEKTKLKFPNVKNINLLPKLLLNDRHLSNSQKYVMALNIPSWDDKKVFKAINMLNRMKHCKREHIFDPYIADFYWFIKCFPSLELEDIFSQKIRIYKTSLVEMFLKPEKKDLLEGVLEFRGNHMKTAPQILKNKEIDNPNLGLTKFEQGHYYYRIGEYGKAIQQFDRLHSDNSNDILNHICLGFLYLLTGDKEKSVFHIDASMHLGDFKYSNKNLGYHCMMDGKLPEAKECFKHSVQSFGKGSFVKEIESDRSHIINIIDSNALDEIILDLQKNGFL